MQNEKVLRPYHRRAFHEGYKDKLSVFKHELAQNDLSRKIDYEVDRHNFTDFMAYLKCHQHNACSPQHLCIKFNANIWDNLYIRNFLKYLEHYCHDLRHIEISFTKKNREFNHSLLQEISYAAMNMKYLKRIDLDLFHCTPLICRSTEYVIRALKILVEKQQTKSKYFNGSRVNALELLKLLTKNLSVCCHLEKVELFFSAPVSGSIRADNDALNIMVAHTENLDTKRLTMEVIDAEIGKKVAPLLEKCGSKAGTRNLVLNHTQCVVSTSGSDIFIRNLPSVLSRECPAGE